MRPVRLWIGLVLLALGAFLVLDATGTLEAGPAINRWWPMAIVGLGVVAMIGQRRIAFWPTVITLFGLVILADQQNWATGDLIGPAILILIGGAALFGFAWRRTSARLEHVNPVAVFSGTKAVDHSAHLKHTDVTAVFGGATLDLRESHIDETADVDAFVLFGGATVLVPKDWRVAVTGLPIFGGYEDKTSADGAAPDAPLLKVNATAIFGGVEIVNDPK